MIRVKNLLRSMMGFVNRLCVVLVVGAFYCVNMAFALTADDIIKKHKLDMNKEEDRCEIVHQIFQQCYPTECNDIKIIEKSVYEKNEPIDSYIFIRDVVNNDMIGFLSSVGNGLGLSNQELVDNKVYFLKYKNNQLYITNDKHADVILKNCKIIKYNINS
jgi:hypothetical protein